MKGLEALQVPCFKFCLLLKQAKSSSKHPRTTFKSERASKVIRIVIFIYLMKNLFYCYKNCHIMTDIFPNSMKSIFAALHQGQFTIGLAAMLKTDFLKYCTWVASHVSDIQQFELFEDLHITTINVHCTKNVKHELQCKMRNN